VRRFGAPWSADARFWRSFLENRSAETIETFHRNEARVEARVDLPETGDALLPSDRRVTAEKMHSAHVGPWYLSARRWLDATRENDATLKKKTREDAGRSSSEKKTPNESASEEMLASEETLASRGTCRALPSPAFRAYAPNGNFSRKNPGPIACVAFLAETARAPSIRAAAEAALALRTRDPSEPDLGEESLVGKIAWASVAEGVVVLHGFETV
jgi:hypothetical protein